MINASELPCVRLQGAGGEQTGQMTTAGAEQGLPTSTPAMPGSIYPAKRLVLENGSYRPADHDK